MCLLSQASVWRHVKYRCSRWWKLDPRVDRLYLTQELWVNSYFLKRLSGKRGLSIILHSFFQFSIQFYLYSAFNKGALSQSCFTENRPPMSKPRATVARKNSLADNRKKPWAEPDSEGNHLPLVGTGFNPIYWVHLESSHVGMRWQVAVAGRGCPVGLGWISGPGGGGLGTWARFSEFQQTISFLRCSALGIMKVLRDRTPHLTNI